MASPCSRSCFAVSVVSVLANSSPSQLVTGRMFFHFPLQYSALGHLLLGWLPLPPPLPIDPPPYSRVDPLPPLLGWLAACRHTDYTPLFHTLPVYTVQNLLRKVPGGGGRPPAWFPRSLLRPALAR
eukprot:EG_transcript_48076